MNAVYLDSIKIGVTEICLILNCYHEVDDVKSGRRVRHALSTGIAEDVARNANPFRLLLPFFPSLSLQIIISNTLNMRLSSNLMPSLLLRRN